MIEISGNFVPDWLDSLGLLLFPVILYAEMHYRLPFLKGFLYRRQPEVIFDLPYRSETGVIPVLLLLKDAHWFPVNIEKLVIRLSYPYEKNILKEISISLREHVDRKWYHRIIDIDASDYTGQWLNIDCFITINNGKKTTVIRNDNYRTLSQKPFSIFIDPEILPREEGWIWGDLHAHSAFTEDQVEFGPPPECIPVMGRTLGLSFCALTDHSYDLDDKPDSWVENDPDIQKWTHFQQRIHNLNHDRKDFIILPGEEVSVDNGLDRTVHMVVLNDPAFHIGTGDGMEKSLGIATETHYVRTLNQLPKNALAFAAHPFEKPPFSHRLLIHRGTWNSRDTHPRLDGWQILNGKAGIDFVQGREHWVKQLLKGQKQRIYAGNDSHGNFNRFRQIHVPLLRMHEHQHQIFGSSLTAVKSKPGLSVDKLVSELKQETVIISNGPFIELSVNGDHQLTITGKSTRFFGSLKDITIYHGDLSSMEESQFHQIKFHAGEIHTSIQMKIPPGSGPGYYRAELNTKKERFALTNPVRIS